MLRGSRLSSHRTNQAVITLHVRDVRYKNEQGNKLYKRKIKTDNKDREYEGFFITHDKARMCFSSLSTLITSSRQLIVLFVLEIKRTPTVFIFKVYDAKV